MKSKVLSMALLVAAAGAVSARSAEAQEMMGEMQTITAEVIDIACYINAGLKGEDHKMCAQVCADMGLPLGFLSTDGNVYMATGKGMPAPPANDKLREHAAATVTVEGMVMERSGARNIIIEKITA